MSVHFKRLLTTISYVTCLPLAKLDFDDPELLNGLSKYLPIAGLIIGALLVALLEGMLLTKAEPLVVAFLVSSAWLILSNGLHFDGLMDTADGIFSHQNPQRMLTIMSDSRVGNFGVMTGFIVFLGKLIGIYSIAGSAMAPCLLLIPAWARWCELFAIGKFSYAKPEGKGKVWHDTTIFPVDILKGLALPLLVTVAFGLAGYSQVWIAAIFSIASGIAFSTFMQLKLGGQTGDTYGATVEISELGALIALATFT